MIAAIIILCIVAGLAYAGTLLSSYPGYIELGLSSGTYQMPIWYFLIVLTLTIVCAMVAVKILWTLIRLPSIGQRFGKNRRAYKKNALLQKGMLAMGKGQWKRAEKALAKGAHLSAKDNSDPSLFLSIAAQAAQKQGALQRRDNYLLEARQLAAEGTDTFSAALAEAQMHLDTDEAEKALATLKQHHSSHYNNPTLQTLEMAAYEMLGDYERVWNRLKQAKNTFTTKEAFISKQRKVAQALFSAQNSSLTAVELTWSELPKSDRQDESVILDYVSALIYHNDSEGALKVLDKAIKSHYSDALVDAYSQLEYGSSRERLKSVKKWLAAHSDSAYLNFAAAKLCFDVEDYEQATTFANASLQITPLPEVLALLGRIYEAQDDHKKAFSAYKTSLALTYERDDKISGEILPAATTSAALTDESSTAKKTS